MGKSILDFETVALDEKDNAVLIIDQTKLPATTEIISLHTAQEIWDAIYLLQVRGAPAIGVAAAMGIYVIARTEWGIIKDRLAAGEITEKELINLFYDRFKAQKEYINSSRPTAVNLSWALNRMDVLCQKELFAEEKANADQIATIEETLDKLCAEANTIKAEDIAVCRSIGEYGLSLIKPGDGLLTHCNAGQLATCKYGTATAPMYLGLEKGYSLRIYADETRPLLQGARLTSYELQSAGLDVTLICDNMSASVMKKGLINAVFVGCDRVAANGDTANKIGTLVVATVAKRFGVPFYVCAPTSTIDLNTPDGDHIVIEERKPEEVTDMWYEKRMAPEGVKIFNPAFDVTDNELITAIITENGIARAPFSESLPKLCKSNK